MAMRESRVEATSPAINDSASHCERGSGMEEDNIGKRLTAAQVERYQQDGILFPVPVLSADEVACFRAAFEEVAERLGGHPQPPPSQFSSTEALQDFYEGRGPRPFGWE
jgi:hypothetical protein